MSLEANKAVIQRYLEEGPANEAMALTSLTEDATVYDPGVPPSVGPDGQRRRSAMLFSALPDPQFTIEALIVEAGHVVARWTFRGTQRGPFAGIPPTGKPVQMTGITSTCCTMARLPKHARISINSGWCNSLGWCPHRSDRRRSTERLESHRQSRNSAPAAHAVVQI